MREAEEIRAAHAAVSEATALLASRPAVADPGVCEPGDPRFVSTRPRISLSEGGLSGFHFLASMRPIPLASGAVLASRLPPSPVADFLEWGPEPTADWILAGEKPISALIALAPGIPAVQDDRPFNEYYFLRRWVFRSPKA